MSRFRCLSLLMIALLLFLVGCGTQTTSAEMQAAIHDAYTRGRSEALESSGYNEGYEKGHEEGYKEGQEEGYKEGQEAGNSQGFSKGYAQGKESGYASGYETGEKEGRQKGYDEGYKKGVEDVNAALEAENTQNEPEETPSEPAEATESVNYIANKNTKKFHYPDCSSVNDMKENNKLYWTGSRDELIEKGYDPCQRCYP